MTAAAGLVVLVPGRRTRGAGSAGIGGGAGRIDGMPAPRSPSPGRPSAPRPSTPRVGPAPRTGGQSHANARPSVGAPPPGPQRGSSGPGRNGPRVEHLRATTPKLISARAMVLGVVALLAFVLVYPTLHSYLAEKSAVDALRAQVAAAQQTNSDLQADLARWKDPAYITAQARERLSFVMPGETAWRVVDPQTVPGEAPAPTVAAADPAAPAAPWYDKVWQSIQGADQASDEPARDWPTPVPTP